MRPLLILRPFGPVALVYDVMDSEWTRSLQGLGVQARKDIDQQRQTIATSIANPPRADRAEACTAGAGCRAHVTRDSETVVELIHQYTVSTQTDLFLPVGEGSMAGHELLYRNF